jgi:hypothetical protein
MGHLGEHFKIFLVSLRGKAAQIECTYTDEFYLLFIQMGCMMHSLCLEVRQCWERWSS